MTTRPIGYWVKLLDRLIEDSFEEALGSQQLTRRHWQALNVIRPQPVSLQQLDAALAPFLTGPEATAEPVADDLRSRGWIIDNAGLLQLTGAGEAALSALRTAVEANRARIAAGITKEQYATTVDTLARMCANLQ